MWHKFNKIWRRAAKNGWEQFPGIAFSRVRTWRHSGYLTSVCIPALRARSSPCTPALLEMTRTIWEELLPLAPEVLSIKACRLVPYGKTKRNTEISDQMLSHHFGYNWSLRHNENTRILLYWPWPDPEMRTPTFFLPVTPVGNFQEFNKACCRSLITTLSPSKEKTYMELCWSISCMKKTAL